jgi:hypothetical protein
MTKKSVAVWSAVSFVLAAGVVTSTQAQGIVANHHRGNRLRASLSGYNEVPAVSTAGRGSFFGRLSDDESQIEYRLDYSGVEGMAMAAHIHLGARRTNGGVVIWLCGPAASVPPGTPECPAAGGDGPEAAGTLSAAGVIGPAAQGIAPGEFAELVRAIKAGVTYVNVHSSVFPGGEIRGQVQVD